MKFLTSYVVIFIDLPVGQEKQENNLLEAILACLEQQLIQNPDINNNSLYHKLRLLKVNFLHYLKTAKSMYLFQRNKLLQFVQSNFSTTKTVYKYFTKCTSQSNFFLHARNSNAAERSCNLVVPKFRLFATEKKLFSLTLKKQSKPI